jgi:predicted DNA binding CopG/RHH family protein
VLCFGKGAGRWFFCVFTWRGDRIRPVSVRFMHEKEVTLMSKKFPDLKSDEDAHSWLQGADLAEYDLSGMKKVRFELARKDASISLRLPAALLATLKANAAKANMPTQRLIRMMIEAQLGRASAKPRRKPLRKVAAPERTGKRAA